MKLLLIIIMSFVSFSTLVSGIFLACNEDGLPPALSRDLLSNTPFKNFLIPGIMLIVVVGFTNLFAVYLAIKNTGNPFKWSIAAGLTTIGWIAMQVIFTNSIHWLHFIILVCGIFTVLIAYQLKGKWAV